MNYNQQLRAFYKNQGLTGKHLRGALKHDRRRIRKLSAHTNAEPLCSLFVWGRTREGCAYWNSRDCGGFL